jgi:hypothetical protein
MDIDKKILSSFELLDRQKMARVTKNASESLFHPLRLTQNFLIKWPYPSQDETIGEKALFFLTEKG